MHRLYTDLAEWWPLLSPPENYAEEAALYREFLTHALGRAPRSLLELGSGGGHLASQIPADVDLHLVDLAPEMLQASRKLNPQREHCHADMRSLRLARAFDAVLLHDAVMYLLSESDLAAAYETAAAHLAPGGVFLVLPDLTRESWQELTTGGGGTAADGRGARLLEWRWDPDPDDTTFRVEFATLLRSADGAVRHVHESHTMGLFSRADHVRLLRRAGFELVEIDPLLAVRCDGEAFLARRT